MSIRASLDHFIHIKFYLMIPLLNSIFPLDCSNKFDFIINQVVCLLRQAEMCLPFENGLQLKFDLKNVSQKSLF